MLGFGAQHFFAIETHVTQIVADFRQTAPVMRSPLGCSLGLRVETFSCIFSEHLVLTAFSQHFEKTPKIPFCDYKQTGQSLFYCKLDYVLLNALTEACPCKSLICIFLANA